MLNELIGSGMVEEEVYKYLEPQDKNALRLVNRQLYSELPLLDEDYKRLSRAVYTNSVEKVKILLGGRRIKWNFPVAGMDAFSSVFIFGSAKMLRYVLESSTEYKLNIR